MNPPLPTAVASQAARARILERLRGAAPAAPLPAPALTPYHQGPFGRGTRASAAPAIDPATLIEPFTRAALAWRAEVLTASEAGWPAIVQAALARHGATRVAIGAGSPLRGALLGPPRTHGAAPRLDWRSFEQPLEDWKAELFDGIDAGVTAADAGLADTGTLLLRPSAAEPRTLSLVPPLHVAVLRTSRLFASLPAAFEALAPERAMPTNLVLVTGPSKTSDIQQTLAYGAHGPKALVIVLVSDHPGAAPA